MEQDRLRYTLEQDVIQAASGLIGCILVRGSRRARIVETEAYRAEDDPACHAYRRRTVRNETMWGSPGRAYIYLNYGLHWMLNVAAHEPGRAAAVLVRAAEPLEGLDEFRYRRPGIRDRELMNGPGKLCRAFDINREDDGKDLLDLRSEFHIEAGEPPASIVSGPRIGIAVGQDLPWRFADATRLPWVSKPAPPRWR